MTKKKKKRPQKEAVTIPVKWNVPDTIITRFASNMTVQIIEGYFKISFFELKPEILLVAPATPPTEIIADCVSSVIIPPYKLSAFIDILTQQLQTYQATQVQAKVVAPIETVYGDKPKSPPEALPKAKFSQQRPERKFDEE
ncbi:MAG: hypothetical protein ABSA46_01660 [Thermodesulfovibrionales bacterium]|jgi:hypothetical protein